MPKSRQEFWQAKFAENVERDRRVQARLIHQGWRFFVTWECEIETDDTVIARLVAFLGPARIAEARRPTGCSGRRQDSLVSSSKDPVDA